MRVFPAFDPRTLDVEGLPFPGCGGSFFNVRIALRGEEELIDGIVCSKDRAGAASLLLYQVAYSRLASYNQLRPLAECLWVVKVSRGRAKELLPDVEYRVSMWKRQCSHTDNCQSEIIQLTGRHGITGIRTGHAVFEPTYGKRR
jgi:hypothetical protein